MKRLLAQIGLTYLSVLAVVFYLDKLFVAILMSLFLLVFILFLAIKKYRSTIYLPVMAAVAVVACLVNICYTSFVYDKTVSSYQDYTGPVVAKLKDEPYKVNKTYRYYFQCKAVGEKKCNFDFVAYNSELLNIEPHDTIKVDVSFIKNENNSSIANGYFLTGSFGYALPEFEVVERDRGLGYRAIWLRQEIRRVLMHHLKTDAYQLTSALLIGDKYTLPYEIRQQFVDSGASHLIVVSGMHFSILASGFFILAKKFRRYRFIIIIPAVVFILVYMLVTGCSPSVVRSGIMLLVCAFGLIVYRETYSLNSLGLAALIITFLSPYKAGDVGLILSFATTYSILKFAPIVNAKLCRMLIKHKVTIKSRHRLTASIEKFFKNIPRALVGMVSVNICAYAVALPLSIVLFDAAPTLSVISSLVLYFPIQILLILALVLSVAHFVPFLSFICPMISCFMNVLTDITLFLVKFFADLPLSYIHVSYRFIYLWAVFSLVLFLWMYFFRAKNRLKLAALLSLCVFLIGYISAVFMDSFVSTLKVYDVDDGMAVVYSSAKTDAVLSFDCSSSNATQAISKIDNTLTDIDFVSAVTNTTRASNSLKSLCNSFAINEVMLYDTVRTVELSDNVNSICEPAKHQTVVLSDGTIVTYHLVQDVYITYLQSDNTTLLILPLYVDIADVPQEYRKADTIVMGNCPFNFELLSCDTLVVSAGEDSAYQIMKIAHNISNRVLLTCENDITLKTEV